MTAFLYLYTEKHSLFQNNLHDYRSNMSQLAFLEFFRVSHPSKFRSVRPWARLCLCCRPPPKRRPIGMRRSNSRFATDAELNENNSWKLIRESLALILDVHWDVPALCVLRGDRRWHGSAWQQPRINLSAYTNINKKNVSNFNRCTNYHTLSKK